MDDEDQEPSGKASIPEDHIHPSTPAWASPNVHETPINTASYSIDAQPHNAGKEKDPSEAPGIRGIIHAFPNSDQLEIIAKIEASWKELNLPTEELQRRHRAVADGIGGSLTKVLQHALQLQLSYQESLQERVAKYLEDIRKVEQMLNLMPDSTSDVDDGGDGGLFQREISLRKRCNELLAMRTKRQLIWTALMTDNKKFAAATGLPSFHLENHSLRLRTDVLEELQCFNNELQSQFVVRNKNMLGLRQAIQAVAQDLRRDIELDFDNLTDENLQLAENLLNELTEEKKANIATGMELLNRVQYLCRRIGMSSLLLESQPTLVKELYDPRAIEQLTAERDLMEQLAKENIRTVILRHRDRILSLYDATYTTQADRDAFVEFASDDFSEALLDAHEAESTRLTQLLEENHAIYGYLGEHAIMMREKLKYEEQETDPVVMVNRGGILLKIQAEKKKVVRDLNKLIADLRAEVEKKSTPDSPFLIGGLTLDEFLTARQRDTEHEKADFIKDRKIAPGSAIKRAKEFKEQVTPTFKRLKQEVGSLPKQPKSGNRTFIASGSSSALKRLNEAVSVDSVERIGKIKRKLDFDSNSAAAVNGKGRARTAANLKARVQTPAADCGNGRTNK
ncbi:hypothetical protein BV898_13940 [Hypsibius exemplaris]|uniref:Protein regulator of cytokinesis 1 n=1 Tax=Hypsibius exemplaris TaxID=2072580 RepID=A0A1W0W9A9_HYPEX|nr:hypothetical protein BV898_13940 [Hypsibius exemplaris]